MIDLKLAEAEAERDAQLGRETPRLPPYSESPFSSPPPSDSHSALQVPGSTYASETPLAQAGRRHPESQPTTPNGIITVPPTPISPISPAQQEALLGQQYQQRLLARCARGDHDPSSEYGVGGIITAVLCFPIGLICLFADREVKCRRCGVTLQLGP